MDPRIRSARTQLLLSQPFFGAIAMSLRYVEDPTCDTFWVDGVTMGYNPDFMRTLSDLELSGMLGHQTLHVTNGHCWRGLGLDLEMWNDGCDYAINPMLLSSGFKLPTGCLIDGRFLNLSAEQIYIKLRDEKAQGQQGAGQRQGRGQQSLGSSGPPKQDSNGRSQVEMAPAEGGGGAKYKPQRPPGEVRQYTGDDKAQKEAQSKTLIRQAARIAQSMGLMSAELAQMIGIALSPSVDWRSVLQRFFQMQSPADYTWTRPNRRYVPMDLFLPTMSVPSLGHIVFVRDTSGSVDDKTQEVFAAEIAYVFHEMKPQALTVIDCDAEVKQVQTFEAGDDLKVQAIKGGGETAFAPPFDWIKANGIEPVGLVYLTDMLGRFPVEPAPFEVLWASTTHPMRLKSVPNFGEIVPVTIL